MQFPFDFPLISGLLICFGPLAVTIIGFIGFAWWTDEDAREPYLRRIDMRTEDEAPEVLPPVITETIQAFTPSKARVTLIPDDGLGGRVIIKGNTYTVPDNTMQAPTRDKPAESTTDVDDNSSQDTSQGEDEDTA